MSERVPAPAVDATAAPATAVDANRWVAARVVGDRTETATARTLLLDALDLRPALAGQHVDIRLTAEDGYTAQRSYSLASAAGARPIAVTVEEFDAGEVSPYLVRDVSVGDELEVRGPIGGWFVWRPEQSGPVQLIAGGSGVVPLLSMIRTHAAVGSAAPFRLLTSARGPGDDYAAHELGDLAGPNLTVTRLHTRRPAADAGRPAGRIRIEDLERAAFPADAAPTIYVCGPNGFVETVSDALLALRHSPAAIRTERFGPTD